MRIVMSKRNHNMKKMIALVPGILMVLAACENKPTIHPDFGNAVLHNKTVHIINPRTADPAALAPELSGVRAAGVMQRYYTGEVKELKIEATSRKGAAK